MLHPSAYIGIYKRKPNAFVSIFWDEWWDVVDSKNERVILAAFLDHIEAKKSLNRYNGYLVHRTRYPKPNRCRRNTCPNRTPPDWSNERIKFCEECLELQSKENF